MVPPCDLNLLFILKNKLLTFNIFLSILLQYSKRPNALFILVYLHLLLIGRHGKILIEKRRPDPEKFGNPRLISSKLQEAKNSENAIYLF